MIRIWPPTLSTLLPATMTICRCQIRHLRTWHHNDECPRRPNNVEKPATPKLQHTQQCVWWSLLRRTHSEARENSLELRQANIHMQHSCKRRHRPRRRPWRRPRRAQGCILLIKSPTNTLRCIKRNGQQQQPTKPRGSLRDIWCTRLVAHPWRCLYTRHRPNK